MSGDPSVSILVVAWGDEPQLGACLTAALASRGVAIEVVVVDNGDRSGQLQSFDDHSQVRIVRPGRNLGFAAGCNLAAEQATGEIFVLVNPDAIVEPTAVAELAAALSDPNVGVATASVRLAERPQTINSAGNPVHYLGLAWAGGHGADAAAHQLRREVASASGACCAVPASWWRSLGGFNSDYFAYHEDVEMSLRSWQQGRSVIYVPTAIAYHHYEFSRNELKRYLLERNRLITVLTTYSRRTLLILAVPLLALELVVDVKATVEGWLPAKARGYAWILGNWPRLRIRRHRIQSERTRDDHELAGLYAIRFTPGVVTAGPVLNLANVVSAVGGLVFRKWAA